MKIRSRLWLIILSFCVFLTLSGILVNSNYFSKVIFTGPISIEIKGDTLINNKNTIVYGTSPTGKKHEFVFQNEESKWKYNYPCFIKSITIKGADSLIEKVSSIIVTSNTLKTNIYRNHMVCVDNHINIFDNKVNKPSFFNLISCVLKWNEPIYLLLGIIGILSLFLVLKFAKILISRLKQLISKLKHLSRKVFLLIILILLSVIHIIVFILKNEILITSGVLLIIFSLCFVYLMIFLLGKIFHFSLNSAKVKMLFVSIGFSLIIVELTMIFTGTHSTYWEKRVSFFNRSGYLIENNSWFRVWSSHHGLKNKEYFYQRSINSEGLSDKEHNVQKDKNQFRIMAIGDSFTEGDGTHQDSTWLKFLEYNLRDDSLNFNIDFMNAGVCGSDIFFAYILFKERLLKYKPEILVLSINDSDISDVIIRGGMTRFQANGKLKYNNSPWWEPIYNMSHLSRILFKIILGYDERLVKTNDGKEETAKELIYQCILDFQKLCIKNQVKLLLVFNPLKYEIIDKKQTLNDVISKIELNTTIHSLNLLDYFIKYEGINEHNFDKYYWKLDGHHNAKGYNLFAKGVEWKLKQMGVFDAMISQTDTTIIQHTNKN